MKLSSSMLTSFITWMILVHIPFIIIHLSFFPFVLVFQFSLHFSIFCFDSFLVLHQLVEYIDWYFFLHWLFSPSFGTPNWFFLLSVFLVFLSFSYTSLPCCIVHLYFLCLISCWPITRLLHWIFILFILYHYYLLNYVLFAYKIFEKYYRATIKYICKLE